MKRQRFYFSHSAPMSNVALFFLRLETTEKSHLVCASLLIVISSVLSISDHQPSQASGPVQKTFK